MSSQFFSRPTNAYAGEAGLPNRTKYYTDSTSSPKVPISSTKIDGDINYLIDAVNALYDTAVSGVVADNSITNAKLRDSAALSVIGRSAATSGDPGDITASSSGQVLLHNGSTLSFGQTTSNSYGAGTVDASALQNLAVSTSKLADLAVTEAKLANNAVTTGKIADNAITADKLADDSVGIAELSATGTPSSSTFLRGDNTWANPRPFFESTAQTITSNGSLALTHGLGYRPKRLSAYLVCVTAERGYAVGDYVMVSPIGTADSTDNGYGCTLYTDDNTQVKVRYGVRSSVFLVTDRTSGTTGALTNSNWNLVVMAE